MGKRETGAGTPAMVRVYAADEAVSPVLDGMAPVLESMVETLDPATGCRAADSEESGQHEPSTALVPVASAKPRRGGAARGTARRRAPRKAKRARWSVRREANFFEALALTANVARSARIAGLADSTIYRRRRTHADFRDRWAEAVREGAARLETAMLDRALNGVEKPVWFGGKQVGTVTEYNDRLAMALLARHGPGVPPLRPSTAGLTDEEVRERLAGRLAEMNRRMGGKG